jgi:hypothetical protein
VGTTVSNPTFVLTAIIGIWAATNFVFTAMKMINERRDAILLGSLDKQTLTPEHKRIMLYSDWLPMLVGLGLLMISGSAALATIDLWIVDTGVVSSTNRFITFFSWIGCIFCLIATASVVIGGIKEFRMMRRAIEMKVKEPAEPAT